MIRSKIAGIGIGMPGFVDAKKGLNYSFLPSNNQSIPEHISKNVDLPVFIDNDSSLIALAELIATDAQRHHYADAQGQQGGK
jgi:predicted NBD/HSP70 family sugar kinase